MKWIGLILALSLTSVLVGCNAKDKDIKAAYVYCAGLCDDKGGIESFGCHNQLGGRSRIDCLCGNGILSVWMLGDRVWEWR